MILFTLHYLAATRHTTFGIHGTHTAWNLVFSHAQILPTRPYRRSSTFLNFKIFNSNPSIRIVVFNETSRFTSSAYFNFYSNQRYCRWLAVTDEIEQILQKVTEKEAVALTNRM